MSGRSLDELLKRRQELNAAVSEATRETKRAKLCERDARRGAEKAWKLPPAVAHTALIIYVEAGYVVEPATTFLANSGRQRHWPTKSEEELAEMVENLFLEVDDMDEFANLTSKCEPSDPEAMRKAIAYVEQWRLATWVTGLNSAHGVAPTTDSVLQRKEAMRLQLPEDVRPQAVGSSSDAKARVWCRRWRLRWGARHARVRIREDVSLEEKRTKARRTAQLYVTKNANHGSQFSAYFWEPFWFPFFGTTSEAASV